MPLPANTPRHGWRAPALGLILAVGATALAGCGQKTPHARITPPTPVRVAQVATENVPTRLEAIGAVQAYSTVSVEAQVSAQMEAATFQQGDFVHRGQILFHLDPRVFQAALASADANVAKDRANYAQAEADAKRYAELTAEGIVSREQNEQMQAAAQELAAAIAADQAAVRTAELNLSYCTIASPVDGRTGALLVHPGNMVQANSTQLVTINQISPIYVSFSVPEQYLDEIKTTLRRQTLPVYAQAQNDPRPAGGRLTFVNNTVDATTGTIQLMGTFANQNRGLWPGEFVSTSLILGMNRDAIVVPTSAILTGQNGHYVYLATPKATAENVNVTTGVAANGVTVVTKGLHIGQTVITDGQLGLYPGAKIVIKPAMSASVTRTE
ncbi:MAG: efflux RND transporter periplasmic adaptor subunit [Terriglobales bacterium]